ncbi:protein YhfH [Bacillus sp. S/N-304-OC-R1]|nr:YhfH family protein [Bacillus sp. S/N-304-OC-R1]
MLNYQTESLSISSRKICQECGQSIKEHVETYLLECDRCLSKKSE